MLIFMMPAGSGNSAGGFLHLRRWMYGKIGHVYVNFHDARRPWQQCRRVFVFGAIYGKTDEA